MHYISSNRHLPQIVSVATLYSTHMQVVSDNGYQVGVICVWLIFMADGRHVNAVILSFDPNEKQSVICERK